MKDVALIALAMVFFAAGCLPLHFLVYHGVVMAGVCAAMLWLYALACIVLTKTI